MAKRTINLLNDKAFCGECGSKLVADCATGKNGTRFYYLTCKKARKEKACSLKHYMKEELEQVVLMTVVDFLKQHCNIELAVKMIAGIQRTDNPELQAAERALADTEKKMDGLIQAIECGMINDKIKARYQELESLKATQIKEIQRIQRNSSMVSEEQVRCFFENIDLLDIADTSVQKYLIDKYVNSVYVYDDRHIDVYLNFFDGNGEKAKWPGVRLLNQPVHQIGELA